MMIAIYVRVSTTEQAENGHSIDEQIDRLSKYCDALGMGKPKVFNDAGFSGANIERPALQLLIREVKSHKIRKVLVYKLDRLSRSQKDTLMLIEDVFLTNGCDFVSISENFDTSTPLGRAMIGILAVFAQLEREQIRERMTMGREARAKQGKFSGGVCPPIGYDYINGELVPNEFERVQIVQIFSDYANGVAPTKIMDKLNESGMTHKYGKWQEHTLRNVLKRKTYIGYVSFGGEWHKGLHEPLISEELFNKVQRIRERREKDYRESNHRAGKPISYLGGLVHCKQCGSKYLKFARRSRGYRYDYYCCKMRYPRNANGMKCHNDNWKVEELETLIFDEIRKLQFEPSSIGSDLPNNSDVISAKVNDLDKQLERLIGLYSLGEMPLEILQDKIRKINDQKTKLENEMIVDNSHTTVQEAIQAQCAFDEILQCGDIDDVRQAICTLIDRIEVDGENVTIYWAF